MATYHTSSSNQRDAVPMLCLRDPLPNPYSQTPILATNMTFYINSASFSEPLSANSQHQSNSFAIPWVSASHSIPQSHEIFPSSSYGVEDLGAWREGRNEILGREGQGLALSLGTQIPSGIQMPNHSSSFDSFLGANPSILGNEACKSASSGDEGLRHSESFPLGSPGVCQDLNRGDFRSHRLSSFGRTVPNSKYLKAVQQLLEEVVDIQKAMKNPVMTTTSHGGAYEELRKNSKEDGEQLENERPSANGVPNSQASDNNPSCELSHAQKQDLHNKLTKLLSMLDEVDSRYKQYYHQMQIMVSSFDVIAGCGAAKPYTSLALRTISCHFRCLRDAITGQISATQKNLGEQDASGSNNGVGIARLKYVDQQIRQQRALQQLGMMQHAWRPQRGLPESSVSILRAWLFEHFLHPYPKDSDKIMLARQTGLTRSQVSNWFINARVRLWKPMIEEMYKQELRNADMDSSSSSEEDASKVSKSDVDDPQHCQSSIMVDKNHHGRQVKDLKYDQILDTETMASTGLASFISRGHEAETERRSLKQTEGQGPNMDNCGLFPDEAAARSDGVNERFIAPGPTCQMSEFERFKSGNRVSLTLGLQHCEGGSFLPGEAHLSLVSMREDDIYNAAAASTTGVETAELECIGSANQQQRFSSPHMLHDFVV